MREFLHNFVDNKLNRLESPPDNRKSFVRGFLEELQNSLDKFRSFERFQTLPMRTRFHLTGIYGDLLEIMSFNNKALYFVPKSVVSGEIPKIGEGLRFSHDGSLILHHGSIHLWEHQIPYFRDQCSLAR